MFESIVYILLLVVTAVDPFFGLIFLLGGFCAYNRAFAYAHIQIGSGPFYITEIFLIIAMCHLQIKKWVQRSPANGLKSEMMTWPWIGFLIIALISCLHGLVTFPAAAVLRDAALAYYALFAWISYHISFSKKRLRMASLILLAIGILKGLRITLGPALANYGFRYLSLNENPAAASMYVALTLLGIGLLGKTKRSVVLCILASIPLTLALAFLLVRSSWLGYTAALFTLGTSLWIIQRDLFRRWFKMQIFFIIAFVLTLNALASIAMPYQIAKQKFVEEIFSFTKGTESDNVHTRLYLWRDALSELFSTGLFSGHLKPQELKNYNLPQDVYDQKGPQLNIKIGARGHQGESIDLRMEKTSLNDSLYVAPPSVQRVPPIQENSHQNRLVRILFGIPFGKPFYPPEVISWLENTKRYDPHNSQIAIAYRMGLLGIFFFLAILYDVGKHLIRSIRNSDFSIPTRVIAAALLSGLVYHQVHSLTDVTMENAFKGAILWVLLGIALRPMNDKTDRLAL